MKVSSGDAFVRLIQEFSAGGSEPGRRSVSGAKGFSRMLEAVVQNGQAGPDARIDKDKLDVMLKIIKQQMSQAVMNCLAGEEGEGLGGDLDFMFRIPDMQPVQQQESKVRHEQPPVRTARPPADMNAIIDKASSRYGVDRGLISSVIQAESGFDPSATSPKGAMGLMQLMPDTARGLGVSNAYDPEQNVMAGTRYLKGLLDRYNGDVRQALAAYNWGMGNLERSTGKLPDETRNYIARIMKSYGRAEG